jgi:hypothetical protein
MIPGLAPRIGTRWGSLGDPADHGLARVGAYSSAGNLGIGNRRECCAVRHRPASAQRHDRVWSIRPDCTRARDAKPPILLRDFNRQPLCASSVAVSDHLGAHLPAGVDACKEMIGSGADGPRFCPRSGGVSGWVGSYLPVSATTARYPPTDEAPSHVAAHHPGRQPGPAPDRRS